MGLFDPPIEDWQGADQRRKDLGINQEDFARMLRVTKRAYQYWIADGSTRINLRKCYKLLEQLESYDENGNKLTY